MTPMNKQFFFASHGSSDGGRFHHVTRRLSSALDKKAKDMNANTTNEMEIITIFREKKMHIFLVRVFLSARSGEIGTLISRRQASANASCARDKHPTDRQKTNEFRRQKKICVARINSRLARHPTKNTTDLITYLVSALTLILILFFFFFFFSFTFRWLQMVLVRQQWPSHL